jgi:hypothetical protein
MRIAAVLLVLAAALLAWDARTQLLEPLPLTAVTDVEISHGANLSTVLSDRQALGILGARRKAMNLEDCARATVEASQIKAG